MEYIRIVVTCAAAIAAGIMLGNSAVVFFNRMPGKWLCEKNRMKSWLIRRGRG